MDKVIVLATDWAEDYWEKEKEAPYSGIGNISNYLPEWNDLKNESYPLAGIGVYGKFKQRDLRHKKLVYLCIKGIDFRDGIAYFDFIPIGMSSVESGEFISKFTHSSHKLFFCLDANDVIGALKEEGETPPAEWLELISSASSISSSDVVCWKDYIGKYFLEIIDNNKPLGNDEFEDRCYNLLRAIGFNVTQWGHSCSGAYPDGEIYIDDDIIVVYDCKNTKKFYLSADEMRKMEEYIENAQIQYKIKDVYGLYIAYGFNSKPNNNFLYFEVDYLVYILYKKIILGYKFNLSPFRKIFVNRYTLNRDLIDKEWRSK